MVVGASLVVETLAAERTVRNALSVDADGDLWT